MVNNSSPAVSDTPKASPQLSKVVGVAMKADSLSRATGKKAERQEGADKGEKAKGESFLVQLPPFMTNDARHIKCIVLKWRRARVRK